MRELCYTGHNERLKNRDYFLLQQRKNLTKPYPLKKVQMSEVWPIQKDSEPRPRFACAGSASLTSVILFCHFALPLIFSSSRIGQTKRSRCRDLFVWPTRKDSNLRPSESESDALSSCATGREGATRLSVCRCFGAATCRWWTRRGSNPRPLRCERSALPAELRAHIGNAIIIAQPCFLCKFFSQFFCDTSRASIISAAVHILLPCA